ncbi:MAG: hypothetical protein OXU30_07850, partial [Gammaproteobacteria bacterium]|nr:hypothetical protein [Gammaproteobacteria bacterium]
KELEQPEPELDLNEELSKSRILDLPDDEAADEESRALTEAEEAELIAEEEAVELSKKPLDEILRMGVPEELLEAEAHEEEEDFDGEVGVDADLDDDDEDDLDVGLTDEDIAANEEFERNLREQSSSAEEDDAAGDEESEDIAPESNVIPLRGNENQVQGEQETDFDFRVEDASHSPVSEFESDAVPDTAIDFVIEEEHQEDASEINFIGDEQDENL